MRRIFTLSLVALLAAAARLARPAAAQAPLSADDVHEIVEQALADAQRRSSLLAAAQQVGHDGAFHIASTDGAFRLELTGQVQVRFDAAFLDSPREGADDFESGFQMRRTRLFFDGELFDGGARFKTTISFGRDGPASLTTTEIALPLTEGVELILGQNKLPFLLEETMSSKRQLAVDRSVMNRAFTQRRAQGITLVMTRGESSLAVAFSDGFDSVNTDIEDDPADWALTARGAWAPIGSLRAVREFTGPPSGEPALVLGLAGHVERSSDAAAASPEDLFALTADALAKGDGWSAYGAFVIRHDSDDNAGGSATDVGFLAQGSVYLTENLEAIARYDVVIPDSGRTGDEAIQTLTLGFNRYFHGHAAKFSVDAQWILGDVDDSDIVSGSGAIATFDGVNARSQLALRAQFQLLF